MEKFKFKQANYLEDYYQSLLKAEIPNYPVKWVQKQKEGQDWEIVVCVGTDIPDEPDYYDLVEFCKRFSITYPPSNLKTK